MVKKILLLAGLSVMLSGCTIQLPIPVTGPDSALTGNTIKKGSLWKTSDSGQSFELKSTIDEKTSITKADILSVAFHPKTPGTIYVSSIENGIFKTENGGEQWMPIAFPPKKIYSFILDKNNPDTRMFASGVVGDWGKIFRTDDGGEKWDPVYTEPGQQVPVTALSQHPADMNVIFAGTYTGTVIKSVDSGDTWKNVGSKIDGIVADIVFDAKKQFVTYLLTFNQKVYYSPDGGVSWIDWEEEKQKEVTALQKEASDVAARGDAKRAEVLLKSAQALMERNQKDKMPPNIVSVAADPVETGVLYAGTNAGIFRSPDYGKYWYELNIIESAKKFPIRSIAISPGDSNEIVFVSGKAFYRSTDKGATWSVTGLEVDRNASFVSYDPFDTKSLFVGLRK